MKILLVLSASEAGEIFKFWLDSLITGVEVADGASDAQHLLGGGEIFDLIIVDRTESSQASPTDNLTMAEQRFYSHLAKPNLGTPLLLIGSLGLEPRASFPGLKVIGNLDKENFSEKFKQILESYFPDLSLQKETVQGSFSPADFCPINVRLLLRVTPLLSDVYIRLSGSKYVKMFRNGQSFTADDLERYLEKKKIQFLYIKKNETGEFIEKLKDDIRHLLEVNSGLQPGSPTLLNRVGEIQEQIRSLADRIGFTAEVKELARQNVKLAIAAVGYSPKLSRLIFSSRLNDENYVSNHSVLLADVACSIAALVGWSSVTTFHKLVMAALFHDFTFKEPELARIAKVDKLEDTTLTPEQLDLIVSHSHNSASILRSLNEVPADVELIVSQHHERPDGSGFPQGLKSSEISPLAALFIIAHDLFDFVEADQADKFDISFFLKLHEKDYQTGAFKTIARSLAKHDSERPLFGEVLAPSELPALKKAG